MKTPISLLAVLLLSSFSIYAQNMSGHHHAAPIAGMSETETTQDWARQKLAKSSRHQEWVKVKNGTREVNSFRCLSRGEKQSHGGGSHSRNLRHE